MNFLPGGCSLKNNKRRVLFSCPSDTKFLSTPSFGDTSGLSIFGNDLPSRTKETLRVPAVLRELFHLIFGKTGFALADEFRLSAVKASGQGDVQEQLRYAEDDGGGRAAVVRWHSSSSGLFRRKSTGDEQGDMTLSYAENSRHSTAGDGTQEYGQLGDRVDHETSDRRTLSAATARLRVRQHWMGNGDDDISTKVEAIEFL